MPMDYPCLTPGERGGGCRAAPYCANCLRWRNECMMRLRAARRAADLCLECGQARAAHAVLCAPCLRDAVERQLRWWERRRKALAEQR